MFNRDCLDDIRMFEAQLDYMPEKIKKISKEKTTQDLDNQKYQKKPWYKIYYNSSNKTIVRELID